MMYTRTALLAVFVATLALVAQLVATAPSRFFAAETAMAAAAAGINVHIAFPLFDDAYYYPPYISPTMMRNAAQSAIEPDLDEQPTEPLFASVTRAAKRVAEFACAAPSRIAALFNVPDKVRAVAAALKGDSEKTTYALGLASARFNDAVSRAAYVIAPQRTSRIAVIAETAIKYKNIAVRRVADVVLRSSPRYTPIPTNLSEKEFLELFPDAPSFDPISQSRTHNDHDSIDDHIAMTILKPGHRERVAISEHAFDKEANDFQEYDSDEEESDEEYNTGYDLETGAFRSRPWRKMSIVRRDDPPTLKPATDHATDRVGVLIGLLFALAASAAAPMLAPASIFALISVALLEILVGICCPHYYALLT